MSYSELRISVETLYKRKVFTFIGGHHMKIRNVAFLSLTPKSPGPRSAFGFN